LENASEDVKLQTAHQEGEVENEIEKVKNSDTEEEEPIDPGEIEEEDI